MLNATNSRSCGSDSSRQLADEIPNQTVVFSITERNRGVAADIYRRKTYQCSHQDGDVWCLATINVTRDVTCVRVCEHLATATSEIDIHSRPKTTQHVRCSADTRAQHTEENATQSALIYRREM